MNYRVIKVLITVKTLVNNKGKNDIFFKTSPTNIKSTHNEQLELRYNKLTSYF